MAIEIFVCRLKSGKTGPAEQWPKDIEKYLNASFSNGESANAGAGGEQAIILRDCDRPFDVVWFGVPFIIVGELEEARKFVTQLSAESRHILDDCAYFWILSEGDNGFLASDRPVVLDWHHKEFEVIASRLRLLLKFPRLGGLSREMHRIRLEIERIASVRKGPWTPTLILGKSGTGKEEVAQSLYEATGGKGKVPSVACGWFSEELLRDELFGHVKGAYTGALGAKKGLLETYKDDAVLLDDFDTAPLSVQGALLGILATPKGEPAMFRRVGEENEEIQTNIWLLFSTNANIKRLLRKRRLREDFIFRFGDRVINIPRLRERPADIPAIAHRIWNELWKENEERMRPLTPTILRHIVTRETKWKGNVRALQALLSLAASMANLPAHNRHSLQLILDEIFSRGPEYHHWVGIITTPAFTGAIPAGRPDIQDIFKLDEGYFCYGLKKNQNPPGPTGSEAEARRCLRAPEGHQAFEDALREVISKRGKSHIVRPGVRLARMIAYVARNKQIDRHICEELCGISANIASDELKLLEKTGLLRKKEGTTGGDDKSLHHQAVVYEVAVEMFNLGGQSE